MFEKLKSWWSSLPQIRRRFMLISFFLSSLTLLTLELCLWWYGDSTQPFLFIPTVVTLILPSQVVPKSNMLTVRETAVLVRVTLLVFWSYYASYQVAVRPVLDLAKQHYEDLLKKNLPASLAALRAYRHSIYFSRVVSSVLSVTIIVLILRWGPIQGVGFLISVWLVSFISCWLQFKAGRYPGTEVEFYEEIADASVKYSKELGRIAALAAAGSVAATAVVEWRAISVEKDKLAVEKDKFVFKQHKFEKDDGFREKQLAFEKEKLAFEKEQADLKKKGWFR
jgi:hypothetical protein